MSNASPSPAAGPPAQRPPDPFTGPRWAQYKLIETMIGKPPIDFVLERRQADATTSAFRRIAAELNAELAEFGSGVATTHEAIRHWFNTYGEACKAVGIDLPGYPAPSRPRFRKVESAVTELSGPPPVPQAVFQPPQDAA